MAGRHETLILVRMWNLFRRIVHFFLRHLFAVMLVVLGLMAQVVAATQLLTHSSLEMSWELLVGAQVVGATLLACGLAIALPARYRAGRWGLGWIWWSFAAIVPLLGAAGACVSWLLLLLLPSIRDEISVVVGLNSSIASQRADLADRSIQDSLFQLLMRPDINERRRAIMAVRQLRPEQALPILFRAVRDSDESVRMFALGCLQRIASQIDNTMRSFEESLKQAEPEPRTLTALAEQYNELVYLGLAEGHRKRTYQERAVNLTREAAELRPKDQTLWMNHLRYAIRAGDMVSAENTLARLKTLGADPDSLAVWELEFFYISRRWDDVLNFARQVATRPHPKAIAQVLQAWTHPEQILA
jgi:hypothetical protein